MLLAASTAYGDAGFVDTLAVPGLRIEELGTTDLIVQSSIVANSRDRATNNAVYLGHGDGGDDASSGAGEVYTTVLSAEWIVDDSGARWRFGSEDHADALDTYVAPTPTEHSWADWDRFYLANRALEGTTTISNGGDRGVGATRKGSLRPVFGGDNKASVVQVTATSSAAGGNGSGRAPSFYTQVLSVGRYGIEVKRTKTVWRVLAGIAAGLGATLVMGFIIRYLNANCRTCCEENAARVWSITCGVFFGASVGLLTGFFYGIGSIIVPTVYDGFTGSVYGNSSFDNFAVCSQWPNTCGEQDAFLVDGWFVDNPALVANIAQYQSRHERGGNSTSSGRLKVIITNCNEQWNTTFNRAQILNYFSSYFNQDVAPGGFLWAPGYWAPYRSPQIFENYYDEERLDAAIQTIPGSNLTTAILQGTTIDNPSFAVSAGLSVEMLLINLNEPITTFVVGRQIIEDYTPWLANMTSHIATNEVLIQRVRDFMSS